MAYLNSTGKTTLDYNCDIIITRNVFDNDIAYKHFKTLYDQLDWNNADIVGTDDKKRKVILYGQVPYTYGITTHSPQKVWHPLIKSLLNTFNALKGTCHNQVLVSMLENGDFFLPPHQDSENNILLEHGIGAMVFGSSRILRLNKGGPYQTEDEMDFLLHSGDVYEMTGDLFQKKYFHGIPKYSTSTEPRISLTFRTFRESDDARTNLSNSNVEINTISNFLLEMTQDLKQQTAKDLYGMLKPYFIANITSLLTEHLNKFENKLKSVEDVLISHSSKQAAFESNICNRLDKVEKSISLLLPVDDVNREETMKNLSESASKLTQLQNENEVLKNKLADISDKLNESDQYNRRLSILLMGEEERLGENTDRIIVELGRKIGLRWSNIHMIQRSHRLGKRDDGKIRPIIARFLSYRDWDLFMKAVYDANLSVGREKIVVRESLTPTNLAIFNSVLKIKKEKSIFKYVYTRDGVTICQSNSGQIHYIRNENDRMKLVNKLLAPT